MNLHEEDVPPRNEEAAVAQQETMLSDGALIGVEDLTFACRFDALPQMDLGLDLEFCQPTSNNLTFNNAIEDNLVIPDYSENSLLQDALEELQSSATSCTDMPLSTASSCHLMASQPDEFFADFIDIAELLGNVDETNSQQQFDVGLKNEAPEKTEIVPEEKEDIISISNNKFLDFFLNDNVAMDGENMFPNLMMDDRNSTQTETVDMSDQAVSIDVASAIPNDAANNLLEILMINSGIKHEPEDPIKDLNITSGNKRKCSSEVDYYSSKSPKVTDSDFDENCSVYSSCVSSPEDRVVERRKKNNMASKVSRANRKFRHQDLFTKEQQLKEDNAKLRIQLEKMSKEAAMLRTVLINKLSGNN